MRTTADFYLCLIKTSIRASIAKRGAFLIELALMVANNFIFLALWGIFFRQFENVRGWTFNDMQALMAIGTGGYGLMLIGFGGVKQLSRIIVNGDLDPFLTQPKNVLLHIAGSTSLSKGWGQLMTSVMLGSVLLYQHPWFAPLFFICVICACATFTAVNLIAHCAAFWIDAIENVSKRYCDALFLFALYPGHIYSGLLQMVMFTLIPAGIISFLPIELLRNFSWTYLIALVGGAALAVFASYFIFKQGLSRYESGNRFGVRS